MRLVRLGNDALPSLEVHAHIADGLLLNDAPRRQGMYSNPPAAHGQQVHYRIDQFVKSFVSYVQVVSPRKISSSSCQM